MSYTREYDDRSAGRVSDSLRDYFEDMRQMRRGGYDSYSYDRPNRATMGFDGRRSRGSESEEYGRYEHRETGETYKAFERYMRRYWSDMKEALRDGDTEHADGMLGVMAMIAGEAVRHAMDSGSRGKGREDGHKRLMRAVDKVRRAPMQDRNRIIREMFPQLQGNEQKVLLDLVAQESVEQRARKLHISEAEYCEAEDKLAKTLPEEDDDDDD